MGQFMFRLASVSSSIQLANLNKCPIEETPKSTSCLEHGRYASSARTDKHTSDGSDPIFAKTCTASWKEHVKSKTIFTSTNTLRKIRVISIVSWFYDPLPCVWRSLRPRAPLRHNVLRSGTFAARHLQQATIDRVFVTVRRYVVLYKLQRKKKNLPVDRSCQWASKVQYLLYAHYDEGRELLRTWSKRRRTKIILIWCLLLASLSWSSPTVPV